MPGPGGGGRSGGGGGRGGFSGGSHGGGFGGGHHGGGHHGGGPHGGGPHGGGPGGPHMGGWHHGPRHHGGPHMGGWYPRPRHYGGGGCLGSVIGILLLPIIMIIVIVSIVGTSFMTLFQGGTVFYDENKLQSYTDEQYAEEFGSSTAYEDNLLITVVVDDEECYSYYYIAWVGDHVQADIRNMLGSSDTTLGQAMDSSINASSYKYSLDSDLAQVVQTLTEEVQALGLESSFTCNEDHKQVQSHLTNHTDLPMTAATLNNALTMFTEQTGISTVIVVEDMEDVFGKTIPISTIILIVVLVLVAVLVVVAVVKAIRRRSDQQDTDN